MTRKIDMIRPFKENNIATPPGFKPQRSLRTQKLIERFYDYCRNTTLHGWQYLESESSLFSKLIWIFIVLALNVSAIFLVVQNVQEFRHSASKSEKVQFERKVTKVIKLDLRVATVQNF